MPFIHCPPGAFNLAEAFDYRRSGRTRQYVHLSRLRIRKWREHNTQPKHSSPLRQGPVKARHQMFLLNPGSLNYCFNEDLFLFVVLFQRCDRENSAHYFDLIQRHARQCLALRPPTQSAHAYIKHTVWLAPSSPELLKRRGVLPGEAKLSAGEGEESKGAAESTHFASARLFHGVFLSIKSVTFSQSHQRKAAFHCISRQTVCTVINCFPRCDVLCTLVILCCWQFFFSLLWSKQNSLFRPRNQPPDTVNKKMSISCC